MQIFEFKNPKESKEISLLFKIVNIGLYCLLIPALILFFAMSISFIVTKKQTGIPMFLNHAVLTVSSGSMVDNGFEIGDQILIKKVDSNNYKVGDFVAFFDYEDPNCSSPDMASQTLVPRKKANTSRKIFHEIIEIITDSNGNKWFRTKGSNNALPDGNIIYQNYLIGKYQSSSKSLNNLISFIFSINGALIFVVLPCGIILCKDSFDLACIIIDIQRRKKKMLKNKFDIVKQSEVQGDEKLIKKKKRRARKAKKTIEKGNKSE